MPKLINTEATNQPFAEHYVRPEGIYALAHSVGPMCKASEQALNEHYLQPWQQDGGDAWPMWLSQIEAFTLALSRLLNAEQHTFCPQPSVSLGFSQWLAAAAKNRVEHTRHKVVLHEEAFASLGFAVKGLCDVYHLQLELVSFEPNDMQAWEHVLSQKDVFATLITHAFSNTGQLSKVDEIIDIAQKYDVLSAVDIAQSVGIIPIDLKQWHADCVVGSCVKWLSGGPGAAFLYIAEPHIKRLEPEHLAWFSHENPFEFDIRDFRPASTALRFWGGTPAIAPYCMAAAAIETVLSIGVEKLRAHNLALIKHFISSYPNEIPRHYQQGQFSGSLCLPLSQQQKTQAEQVFAREQVRCDFREQNVRLSFGVINNLDDVERVLLAFK
jgi:kynureninase